MLPAQLTRRAMRAAIRAAPTSHCARAGAARDFSTKRKILIPTSLDTSAADILREADYEVIQDADVGLGLVDQHPDAYGMIVRSEAVTQGVLDKMEKLQVLVRAGAGYNTIDTQYARRRGVDVMNTPGANANAVAEEVIAMALATMRHLVPADASTRAGKWEKKKFMGTELAEKTFGILGIGAIGQLVAKRLAGFDCKLIGYDPLLSPARAKELGISLMSVEEVFSKSDVVTLHIPENNSTKGMVNKELLRKMKDGATVINCARAGVLNEDDFRVVKAEKNLVLCNDVYPKDIAGDKPIADIADILLPHIGANTKEANRNAAQRAATQIVEYADKGLDHYVVNRALPKGLDERHQLLAFYSSKIAHHFLGGEGNLDSPEAMATVFYGSLHQFEKHLLAPVVMGLQNQYEPVFDMKDMQDYMKKRGIKHTSIAPDNSKGYGESITIDLTEGSDSNSKKVSLRATMSEGVPLISRINDYNSLYFDPRGNSLLVEYPDAPGMLAKISRILADQNINITDIRAPQDKSKGTSLAILKVDQTVPETLVKAVKAEVGGIRAVFLRIR